MTTIANIRNLPQLPRDLTGWRNARDKFIVDQLRALWEWKLAIDQLIAENNNPTRVEGHVIQDEGADVTQRELLNFTGSGVRVTDNAATGATDVTIDVNQTPAFVLSEIDVDIGARPKRGGSFLIEGSDFAEDKPVFVQQAMGPYVGKGNLPDEAEMDQLLVVARVVNENAINCVWSSATVVRGCFKFNYLVSN